MAFDFPASPTPGQEYTPAGGPTYVWQPPKWVVKGSVGGLTTGGVTFGSATGFIAQDTANLFFDDASNQLTVGGAITSPSFNIASSPAYFSGDATVTTINFDANDFIQYNRTNDTLGINVAAAERLRITAAGRVGLSYTPIANDATLEVGGPTASGGGIIRANIGTTAGREYDPGLIIRNLTQRNDLQKGCTLIAQGRTVAGVEAPAVGSLTWYPEDVNWANTSCGININKAGVATPAVSFTSDAHAWFSGALHGSSFSVNGPSAFYIGSSGANPLINFDANDYIIYNSAADVMSFSAGGGTRFEITPSGLSVYGIVVATGQIRVQPAGNGGAALTEGQPANTGYLSLWNPSGGRLAYIGFMATVANTPTNYVNENGGSHLFNMHVAPATDGTIWCGMANNRWFAVAAVTGTIQTCDEREKDWLGAPDEAAIRAAGRIIDELGFFTWKDYDDTSIHLGVRAQQVLRILIEEGLEEPLDLDFPRDVFLPDPPSFRYAFVQFDTWEETVTEYAPREDGTADPPTVNPAGNRFSMNLAELGLFVSTAQHARMNAIEARLAALET